MGNPIASIEDKLTAIEKRGEELHAQIARLVDERNDLRDALLAVVQIGDAPAFERANAALRKVRAL